MPTSKRTSQTGDDTAPPLSRSRTNEASLPPDRWFRLFDEVQRMMVKIDLPPSRDEDVLTLAKRLSEVAGSASGQLALDLSMVEEYTTTWIKILADLGRVCNELGGQLEMAGICPTAEKVLEDTTRLQVAAVGRKNVGTGFPFVDRRKRAACPIYAPRRINIPA